MAEIPMKVLNRLRIGRDVAARAEPREPGHLAWVYVFPLVNEEEGYWTGRREDRFVHTGPGSPLRGFVVRYLEVDRTAVEQYFGGLGDDMGYAAADERLVVENESALARVLGRWLSDFGSLHVPLDVQYVFQRGPGLLRPPPPGPTRQ